ncbi:actin family protein [Nitzschia inconspicua]|uniref:Actin family protein n=1 Tax=Nitzschia inconspicua TaxID=303405 RepID=A0A9K3KPA0_9STRA|nr:actin family protein [Nitzschia inconspicua]
MGRSTSMDDHTLVIDIGAHSIKVGFAGKLVPVAVVPCVMAEYRNNHWKIYKDVERKMLIADEALETGKKQKLGYHYPIDAEGKIKDWKLLEALLGEALQRLQIGDPINCKLLITKPNKMKQSDLKMLLDIFYFKFGFGAVTMHGQAALALYMQNAVTGVVVEMGDAMTHITPVYKGHAIPKADKTLAVGGRDITNQLLKLLRLKGHPMNDREDSELGRQIKEQLCYISTDLIMDEQLASETTALMEFFKLVDGTTVSLSRERFEAAEVLFKPELLSIESKGISDIIFDVIQNVDIDCRPDLYCNIILSGGTSLLHGLPERINKELNERYTREVLQGDESRSMGWKPQVHAPKSRKHLVFEGATVFASLISSDTSFWVTSQEYSQGGIQCVLEKCNIH